VGRGALDITPVRLDSIELYSILRSRLFDGVTDERQRRSVGQAYSQSLRTAVGEETLRLIRERGWTHWCHLFTPRHLLIGQLISAAEVQAPLSYAAALAFCRVADRMSRLCQWAVGSTGRPGVAPNADFPSHVFYNQALNTFANFACRGFTDLTSHLEYSTPSARCVTDAIIEPRPASDVINHCDMWVTDPPYADAIHYHEITEYFIAWLAKSPPRAALREKDAVARKCQTLHENAKRSA
jgi:putative DNA methylase